MKKFFLLLMLATNAYGQQWRLLEPTDVFIDAYEYEAIHDPYLKPEDEKLKYGANFNLDLDVLKYKGYGLHWRNLLHFDQSAQSGQVKHAGWQYEVGATVWTDKRGCPKIQAGRQHHSKHILEDTRDTHFPVYDRYFVRFNIVNEGCR